MFQTGDHDLTENDHATAPHPCTAVNKHGRVCVLWIVGAVGVPPHRLNLLQICYDRVLEQFTAPVTPQSNFINVRN